MKAREEDFGTHYKEPPQRTPFYKMLINALDDLMLKILIACACANIIVGYSVPHPEEHPWLDGTVIFIAVAVVSIVSSVSDYRKEGEFVNKLKIEINAKVVSKILLSD